ncbi:MAG: 50S ribosomal protein L4 [Armatimonadota bacterium]|nr:MAG: 50S ribosomal protein L4 [Armatimonadota bacterium]
MASAPLFDAQGRQAGTVDLSDGLFGVEGKISLVHQKLVAERNAQRQGTSDTRTRGEVSGGGRKPYRQKGTGRARQGSIRAPHYAKGGTVFGPHPRDYTQKMPRRMRLGALRSALSLKAQAGEVLVIEEFHLPEISTRTAALLLDAMGVDGKATVVLPERDEVVLKSVRNIPGVQARRALDLSVEDVVGGGRLVITRAALEKMQEVWAG